MNSHQRLYLVQARSDWAIYRLLKDSPTCHRLHYLQMCMEKLGKAYFWGRPGAAAIGHAAFVKFLRTIASHRNMAARLGFGSTASFREWAKDASNLAFELERLAPALAEDGPNPEYPWPRHDPRIAPVEYKFEVWERLLTPHGHCLLRLIDHALQGFEELF